MWSVVPTPLRFHATPATPVRTVVARIPARLALVLAMLTTVAAAAAQGTGDPRPPVAMCPVLDEGEEYIERTRRYEVHGNTVELFRLVSDLDAPHISGPAPESVLLITAASGETVCFRSVYLVAQMMEVELYGWQFGSDSADYGPDLNSNGMAEVVVNLRGDVNACNVHSYVLELGEELTYLLRQESGGHAGFITYCGVTPHDVDHDGTSELLSWYDFWANGGWPFACPHSLTGFARQIYSLGDDGTYGLATKEYGEQLPNLDLPDLGRGLTAVLHENARFSDGVQGFSEEDYDCLFYALLADYLALGREDIARAVVDELYLLDDKERFWELARRAGEASLLGR